MDYERMWLEIHEEMKLSIFFIYIYIYIRHQPLRLLCILS